MEICFEEIFGKDLRKVNDKKLLKKVENIITEVKGAKTLNDIRNVEKLKGYETYYRIRIGSYRVGVDFIEGRVIFTRFLHRKDIYRYFP
ncbi:MAG: hypothetical protein U0586_16825 [Candidatus Brocadiaceae bacterium]